MMLTTLNSLMYLPFLILFIGPFALGTLKNKNYILYLLCLEVMLAGINLGFVFTSILNSDPQGLVYATLILGIAAAEVALGIAIIILLYDLRGTSRIVC